MSIPQRIGEFLDSQGVRHDLLPHAEAFAAQDVAHSLHVSGRRLAKAVVLDADGRLVMAVLPASHRLDLAEFQAALEARRLAMLSESELAKIFPDCQLGAVPPFGNLYGIDVWMDSTLAETEEIVVCAGTHADCLRMKSADYLNLVKPKLGRFSEVWANKAA